MDKPTVKEQEELDARAERLAERTILGDEQARMWVYLDEGYSARVAAEVAGNVKSTGWSNERHMEEKLEDLWRTIEILDLDEGQTHPNPEK